MVFKEVGGELPEVWKPVEEGESIEGKYVQKKEKVGQNQSCLYVIDVNGEHKSVWGSTVLDDKMSYCEVGDQIRITYQGEDEKKNYHKYLVEKDTDEEESKTDEPEN